MIIKYCGQTQAPNKGPITHWYDVKLVEFKWTSITIGLNENGKWVSASNSFYELPDEQKQNIIKTVEEQHARIIK